MEDIGKYIWIEDEEYECLPGKIVGVEGENYKIEIKINGITEIRHENKFRESTEVHPSCLKGVDDLLFLGDFNKQTLLHNSRERFSRDLIYSFIGTPILIAMNPYKYLPIYEDKQVMQYKNFFARMKSKNFSNEAPVPHLYHIAEAAYQDMINEKANQCIIICGESGSGKTQSTKIILKYLAMSSLDTLNKTKEDTEISVEKQVLDSNPLLEAFGNAKTIRNNNSSRFGKFIQVNFTQYGKIISAKIFNYLLEKSRIVKIQKEERSYHIFYQLLFGADETEKKKFYIKPPEYFRYLNQSECVTITSDDPDCDDKANFKITKDCMVKLKFNDKEINYIFHILMGILYLGNISFLEVLKNGVSCAELDMTQKEDFKYAAGLLGIEKEVLKHILTTRKMKDSLSGSYIEKNLSVDAAYNTRDAISKTLYAKMFDWIVRKVNSAISNTKDKDKEKEKEKGNKPLAMPSSRYIGLLDIFGFENFELNSFEQLCINYANERLQQYFNNHIFKMEQEEYKKENIDWSSIPFIDNISIVDLIDNPKMGIFSLLDSEGLLKNCNDTTFQNRVYENLSDSEALAENIEGYIGIHHYAGDVYYDTEGFIEKNTDNISQDITDALEKSKNSLIAKLCANSSATGQANKIQSDTLSKQFKKQLDDLLKMLSQSNPRYVKCIKPNMVKKPVIFDSFLVGEQLLSAGVLEAIKIRKQGYSVRRTHLEFCERYHQLTPMLSIKQALKEIENKSSSSNVIMTVENRNMIEEAYQNSKALRTQVIAMLDNLMGNEELKAYLSPEANLIQVGLSKIFMKEEVKNILENKLNRVKYLLKLQSSIRKFIVCKYIRQIFKSSKVILSFYRMHLAMILCKRMFKARSIQRAYQHSKYRVNVFVKLHCLFRESKVRRIQKSYRHFKQKKIILLKLNKLIIESRMKKMRDNNTQEILMDKEKENQTPAEGSGIDLANLLDNLSLTNVSSIKRASKRKSVLKGLSALNGLNSVVESGLVSEIQQLNDEISALKAVRSENEQLKEENSKLKEMNENKEKQIENSEEKLKLLTSVTMKSEEEMREMIKEEMETEMKVKQAFSSPLIEEEMGIMKRKLNEYETSLEIFQLKYREALQSNEELSKMNESLKDQIAKRKGKDLMEINALLDNVHNMEREKVEYEAKIKELKLLLSNASNTNPLMNTSSISNFNTLSSKEASEYKKQISHLKIELKNAQKKYDDIVLSSEIELQKINASLAQNEIKLNELNATIAKQTRDLKDLSDMNKKLKDIINDYQIKLQSLEKAKESANDLLQTKSTLEITIRKKEEMIYDLNQKIENYQLSLEKSQKMELAYKEQLNKKHKEIEDLQAYNSEILESISIKDDEIMKLKKEIYTHQTSIETHSKEMNLMKTKYEEKIQNKNQEIFIMQEKETQFQKYITDMKEIIKKKQVIIENKKKENLLLVEILKNKKGEVQCLDALLYTNSASIKENLAKIRDKEKILIQSVEDLANNPDYTDGSDFGGDDSIEDSGDLDANFESSGELEI